MESAATSALSGKLILEREESQEARAEEDVYLKLTVDPNAVKLESVADWRELPAEVHLKTTLSGIWTMARVPRSPERYFGQD